MPSVETSTRSYVSRRTEVLRHIIREHLHYSCWIVNAECYQETTKVLVYAVSLFRSCTIEFRMKHVGCTLYMMRFLFDTTCLTLQLSALGLHDKFEIFDDVLLA